MYRKTFCQPFLQFFRLLSRASRCCKCTARGDRCQVCASAAVGGCHRHGHTPQTQRLYLYDVVTEKELTTGGNGHLNTTGPNASDGELYTTDILRNALHVNTEKFSTARPTHIKRACGIASQTLLLYMYDAVLRRRLTSRRRCRSDRPCCRCSGPDSRRWYSAPPPWARPRPRSRSGASPWCHRRT